MSSVDVVVIGGGVIGCAIAWRLALRGCRVTLLERGSFGAEASWAAGGILSPNAEFEAGPLFTLAQQSLQLYPAFIHELRQHSDLDPNLLNSGLLALAYSPEETLHLQQKHPPKKILSPSELLSLEPHIASPLTGAFFPDALSIEPRALFSALLDAATKAGVTLRPQSPVRRILSHQGRLTGLELTHQTLACQHVVLAAGAWTSLLGDVLPTNCVYPVRGQVLLLEPPAPVLSRVVYAHGGYLVPRKNGNLLIGATSELVGFEKGLTVDGLQFLLSVALKTVPSLQQAKWLEAWSGLRPATKDGLPLLGESHLKNLWMAAGHYRNGILLTPITAQLISSLIMGEAPSSNLDPFSVRRFL
jgi:glycine oxidase